MTSHSSQLVVVTETILTLMVVFDVAVKRYLFGKVISVLTQASVGEPVVQSRRQRAWPADTTYAASSSAGGICAV